MKQKTEQTKQKEIAQFLKRLIRESKDKNKDGTICIFTDIDGTIIPEASASFDKFFIYTLQRTKERLENKLAFIANTGRTPNDVKNTIKQSNTKNPIRLFTSILGNNGATSEYKNFFIDQKEADEILNAFKKLGGRVEDIRFATENDIYIHDNERARKYYFERGKKVNISRDIIKDAFNSHLTKITLTANAKTIDELSKLIDSMGYKCSVHEGNSSYRQRSGKKIRRADITSIYCSKGIVLETVANELAMNTFVVMGNDENDITMFEAAIDKGGYIVLVENNNPKVTDKLQKKIAEHSRRKRMEQG